MLFANFNILSCDSREKYSLKKNTPLFLVLIFRIYISHDIKLLCFKLSSKGLKGVGEEAKINVKSLQTDGRQTKSDHKRLIELSAHVS